MWSSVQSTKDGLAALKKLAEMMHAAGLIDQKSMKKFKETVKEEKEDWIENVALYNDKEVSYGEYLKKTIGFDPF